MLMILISFLTFSEDINLILQAKSSKEIENVHRREVLSQLLHQRCDI